MTLGQGVQRCMWIPFLFRGSCSAVDKVGGILILNMNQHSIEQWKEWGEKYAISFFQTYQWAELITRHFSCLELFPIGNEKFLIPLVKKHRLGAITDSYYGMPFMTTGGILSEKPLDESGWMNLQALLRSLKAGVVTIVFSPHDIITPPVEIPFLSETTHVIDLASGWEKVWKGYTQTGREKTRKAVRLGVTIHQDKSEQSIQHHWNIISNRFEEWNLKPEPTIGFVRDAITTPKSKLYIAEYQGEITATVLVFAHGKEVFLWQGARNKGIKVMGAVNLLYTRVIEDACSAGFQKVNLSGSLGNPRLEYFKKSFGAVKVPVPILKITHPLIQCVRKFQGIIGSR
jgi:hypothetical protein